MLQNYTCMQCTQNNTYTEMNLRTVKWAQWDKTQSRAAEIGLPVWGTPANFNGFCVLAVLLHDSQVVSVSQTLRR